MANRSNITDYIACYEDRELINGKLEKALVIILRTGGCSWSHKQGCLMCGYNRDAYNGEVPPDALNEQFQKAMEKYKDQKMVKIFNSGSFLNSEEIPLETRAIILKALSETKVKIVIESRPEYITSASLEEVKSITNEIEVAIGLETASEQVNKICINKGSNFNDYIEASQLLREYGFGIRTYLLLKPPFLTEADSIEDVWHSMERIRDKTDVISINPVNIQKGTIVEKLWRNNQYRPPWLWSLLEIFKRVRSWRDNDTNPQVISHPSGAGTRRGIHNCKKCDKSLIRAVRNYSQTQSSEIIIDALNEKCECFESWQDLLELEKFTFTACGRIH
jgi:radical SAM enzyme (TIGR01210 family)